MVALLREMGVKKSLATLIEAESLLNDGTAVVVYSILLKAVQNDGLGPWLQFLLPPLGAMCEEPSAEPLSPKNKSVND